MRDYKAEFDRRVAFIRRLLQESGAKGIVFGNSGGKDSALVGILCKAACENTLGLLMPCTTRRNYDEDTRDALALAERYGIESRTAELTPVKAAAVLAIGQATQLNDAALINIAPRLRMLTLYAVAAAEGRLVAGTGNRSEAYVGYFTKWGDGAHDFNPIADLTVTEVYEFLRYLGAPERILQKAPSAALFEGQTDEGEMGLSYAELDAYLQGGALSEEKRRRVEAMHAASEHKRRGIVAYGEGRAHE